MHVSVQRLSPVLVEFAVEVPEADVKAEVERAFKEVAKTARIKGFRPGKAPRDVLQHVYGGQVTRNVAQRLVDTTLPKALAEKSVTPLATLEISPSKLSLTGPFSYRARFEVSPDIGAVKYDGLEARRPSTKVTDEVVTQELERLRAENADLRAPEPPRPARNGDTVVIDFTLDVDGKNVKEANAEGIEVELGAGKALKELEEALVGVSIGDKKDVETEFPAAHLRPDFRGKKGVFHIEVKDIKERVLPALDDEFAKDLGEYENLEALKKHIREKMEKTLKQRAEDAVAEQLVVELCKANPIPVPPSLVRRQSEVTEQEIAEQARRAGQRFTYTEDLRQRVHLDSEVKVRAGLLMAAIARENNVQVTDEDIEKAYGELAEQTGKNVQRLKVEYRDPKKREVLLGMILEDKVLDLIEAKAKITDES